MNGKGSIQKKDVGWFFRSLFILVLSGTVIGTAVCGIAFWHFSRGLPQLISLSDYRPLGVTRILADGGKDESLIGEFYKERRYLIPYDKIPQVVVNAFISAEDDRFFEHQGVNLASIVRAAIVNFRAGHYVQGGSTITQQVVKSLLLSPERSFTRKIKEVVLASRIERNLSKQQILYLYLNQIYLGHGAYGVQAAARTYFRKDVSQLTIAEAAMMAGMPQAPGKFSPHQNPKRAKERQLYVLRRMYENKYISQSQMSEAAAQALKIYLDEDINKKYAAYLVEHLRRYLVEKYGDNAVYEDGLIVGIPVPLKLCLQARKSLREGLREIDKRMGYRGPIAQLKEMSDIEAKLKALRLELIHRKLEFSVLMPDGRLDVVDALAAGGIKSEAELLDVGEVYTGVVTSVDDKRMVAGVMLGAVKAEMPFEKMKWARPVPAAPDKPSPTPSVPSRVVSKGDVILARVDKVEGNHVTVGLDQEPALQGALFSLEATTGNILAMEGGYDFDKSEFNRAVQAQRQPGSAFKPFIYAAALEKGFTPTSIIVDSPIVYGDNETGKWKPDNFESKFYGDTTFRQALIKSRNVPTIKIVQSIQVPYLIEFTKRIGLSAQLAPDLSISLGSGTVNLMELTRNYAIFPRQGRKLSPVFISFVKDRDGKLLEENKTVAPSPLPTFPKPSPTPLIAEATPPPAVAPSGMPVLPNYPLPEDPDQVMDPRVAYVMTHLMKEVVSYGTGHGAKSLGRVAAGKTGTTNDNLDAWFMGFTPEVVTGVWVGFDNQKSIGQSETGARAALPIWLSFMKTAVMPYPESDFNIPPGVVFTSIEPSTGKLAPPNASNSIKEAFIEGTEPRSSGGTKEKSGPSQGEFFKEDID